MNCGKATDKCNGITEGLGGNAIYYTGQGMTITEDEKTLLMQDSKVQDDIHYEMASENALQYIIDDEKETWKEKIEEMGYEDVEIQYSGYGVQGDGACFTGRVNIQKWLKSKKMLTRFRPLVDAINDGKIDADINITHRGRYSFATSTTVNGDFSENTYNGSMTNAMERREKLFNELIDVIKEDRATVGNEMWHAISSVDQDIYQNDELREQYIEDNPEFLLQMKLKHGSRVVKMTETEKNIQESTI